MSDEEVLEAARSFHHKPVGTPKDGMILCEGADGSYYITDPRDDPDFDGNLTADAFQPWGMF